MRTIKRQIVGAVLISNDNHLLLGKNTKGGVYEDLWVIPGGGIDPGETKEQAVVRETQEETGIDITRSKITLLPNTQTGIAEKTLRNTGERVLVDMTFHNFVVEIDRPAYLIKIRLEDDFAHAEWVPFDQLENKQYSPSVKEVLRGLDLI